PLTRHPSATHALVKRRSPIRCCCARPRTLMSQRRVHCELAMRRPAPHCRPNADDAERQPRRGDGMGMRENPPHDAHDRDAQTRAAASSPAGRVAQPVLPLAFLLEEYARDLRRGELATKTIRNYLGVLTLALSCWEEQVGRSPTLD